MERITAVVSNNFLPKMGLFRYLFWAVSFFLAGVIYSFLFLSGKTTSVLADLAVCFSGLLILFFVYPSLFNRYNISIRKIVLIPILYLAGGLFAVLLLEFLL